MESLVENIYCKNRPSVFVISTPFQALCALAAIKQLEIHDYLMIAHLPKGNLRNGQLEYYLKENSLKYIKFIPGKYTYYLRAITSLIRRKTKYDRIFLGNHFDMTGLFYGLGFVSDNADVIYLDDGVLTISLFNGKLNETLSKEKKNILKKLSVRRGFVFQKYFFTIYKNIQNDLYIAKQLSLSSVLKTLPSREKANVIVVGTVIEEYCQICNMTRSEFISVLEDVFKGIRKEYPNDKIIYIPHGRDISEYAINLCEKYNGHFLKSKTMIEDTLIKHETMPIAIFGFTSTALYNLKEIFKETRVVNIVCYTKNPGHAFKEIEGISDYYQKNDIELLQVHLN